MANKNEQKSRHLAVPSFFSCNGSGDGDGTRDDEEDIDDGLVLDESDDGILPVVILVAA